MNIRVGPNGYFICECGSAMRFLDPLGCVPRRGITCVVDGCKHQHKVYLEPVLLVNLAEYQPLVTKAPTPTPTPTPFRCRRCHNFLEPIAKVQTPDGSIRAWVCTMPDCEFNGQLVVREARHPGDLGPMGR